MGYPCKNFELCCLGDILKREIIIYQMVLQNVGHYAPNRPVKIGLRQIVQVQKTDLDVHIMNNQTMCIFFFTVNKDFRKHKNPLFYCPALYKLYSFTY